MDAFPLISVLTFTPLVGGLMLVGLGPDRNALARRMGLAFSLLSLGFAIAVWTFFDTASMELQFVERHQWVPSLGVEYFVGLDGLSLLMVMLSALVVPMALMASWRISERTPLYFALVLFLQAGLFGTFTALNFVHWFGFWELSLIPAFFLIKLWGGPRRSTAATQFFVYTMAGSVALLLGFLAIRMATGKFDFVELASMGRQNQLEAFLTVKLGWTSLFTTKEGLSLCIFFMVFLGFAVKVPIIPFHTWLPAAYAEAPTGTTMLLTGLMSKMGVYGFIRIVAPIFPEQMRMALTPLLWLAVATIICSAAAACAQRDLKRMLAYSSVNHLGYCMLGLFAAMKFTGDDARMAAEKAAVLNGVFLQMFNHGLTAATFFCLVGFLEQRSGGLRTLDDFGGLRKIAPVYCGLTGIVLFASLGLPGLSGFVGEFLIFKGPFALAPSAAVVSSLGLLITAIFLLTFLQQVFNGPLNERWSGMPDLSARERLLVVPAILLIFALGICPQVVLSVTNATVMGMVEALGM